MKIRTGFVSNSSSMSITFFVREELNTIEDVRRLFGSAVFKYMDGPYDEEVEVVANNDELAEMLFNHIRGDDYKQPARNDLDLGLKLLKTGLDYDAYEDVRNMQNAWISGPGDVESRTEVQFVNEHWPRNEDDDSEDIQVSLDRATLNWKMKLIDVIDRVIKTRLKALLDAGYVAYTCEFEDHSNLDRLFHNGTVFDVLGIPYVHSSHH